MGSYFFFEPSGVVDCTRIGSTGSDDEGGNNEEDFEHCCGDLGGTVGIDGVREYEGHDG